MLIRYVSYFLLAISILVVKVSTEEHIIYWNSTSSIFKQDQPSLSLYAGDKLRVVCPTHPDPFPFLTIYAVSEMASSNCLLESSSIPLLHCDSPAREDKNLVLLARGDNDHSPLMGLAVLNLTAGNTYHLITTSGGATEASMAKRQRGLCQMKNMRVVVTVNERPIGMERSRPSPQVDSSEHDAYASTGRRELSSLPFEIPPQLVGFNPKHVQQVVAKSQNGVTGSFPAPASGSDGRLKQKASREMGSWDPMLPEIFEQTIGNAMIDDENAFASVTYSIHDSVHDADSLSLTSSSSSNLLGLCLLCLFGRILW